MTSLPRCIGLATVVLALAAACSGDDPASPGDDPLAGLTAATRGDTAPEAPPDLPRGPGYFVGTVYGYDPGPDTLASAVKLAGVRVSAFTRVDTGEGVTAGRQVATVLTDAKGFFQLPTLPGGEYVVTFVPGAASPYRGGWTTAGAWQQSGDNPWYIMLARK
jgi:hypothetical protein